MKLRTGDPWMPAPAYGRSLRGLSLNLLARPIAAALPFHREVLGGRSSTAILTLPSYALQEAEWMLHADHTYLDHPLHASRPVLRPRGIGAELRLHGRDPDAAEAVARRLGYTVPASAIDKPHGLREAYLLDTDGYPWVPPVPRAQSR